MRRYVVWFVSGLVALPFFIAADAAGLSQLLVILITFAGCILGAILGTMLVQKYEAARSTPTRAPPRGRGSGRKAG